MDSGSQPANSADQPPQTLANMVGTLIAVLTLILPVWIIGYYSSNRAVMGQPITSPISSVSRD